MTCREVLSGGHIKLDDCLRYAAIHDASALSRAMGDFCGFIEQSTALECLESGARCREQCAVREEYRSGLLEFHSKLPSIRTMLEAERARLAREKRFLEVARSWAEYSQPLFGDSP